MLRKRSVMTTNETGGHGAPRRRMPAVARKIRNVLRLVLLVWPQRRRQRARLLELEPHELRDIGMDRADALHEGRKPFWR